MSPDAPDAAGGGRGGGVGWCPACQRSALYQDARCKVRCPLCHYTET